ncbi:Protein of unknown function [Gryllus bimaculatus]|nr:Protein of unknown function [Gryllus bimaculatus]
MRIQGGKYLDLEDALLQWFQKYRAEGRKLSRRLCITSPQHGRKLKNLPSETVPVKPLQHLPVDQTDFTEFVDVDKDVVTSGLRSIEDVVSEINKDDEDSDDEVEDNEINLVGFSEAIAALETVKKIKR